MVKKIVRFFLENKLVAYLFLMVIVGWGMVTAPFDFGISWMPRDPISVDAIPDIGDNQQIVYTEWAGRSPQDVEDQITYPMTSTLLGIPGVKSIRSNSMFGFSTIYLIFDDDIEFYWSRSRILEKINALPANLLPVDAKPVLGPDATALGQVFWYTLEGQDEDGNATGGWDLQELRSIQDFYVKYGLMGSDGVSEVASVGGFVKEYQVDVNPEKMRIYNITLDQVMKALKESNMDIGAQTLEVNKAEYFVRGLGYVKSIEDIEASVVLERNNTPIRIKDIAVVNIGPKTRRGVLDKSGAEAVGGVVVARYGSNPMEVIDNVKAKMLEIAPGLPSKLLADGTKSQVTIVPFYDRSDLIGETIGTLQEALSLEILITIIVVILMLLNLQSSFLVSGALPVAVLMVFIAMRYFGIEANIVALSGIAIAIGTMVDMGIVLVESMLIHIKKAPDDQSMKETIYEATIDVASAVITAVATTIVSFLPVFTMQASEGKLFRPLAFTKTFALVASIIVAVTIMPVVAQQVFSIRGNKKWVGRSMNVVLILFAIYLLSTNFMFIGIFGLMIGIFGFGYEWVNGFRNGKLVPYFNVLKSIVYAGLVAFLLTKVWLPMGVNRSFAQNFIFVITIIGVLIGSFYFIIHFYENILRFLLKTKWLFLIFVAYLIYLGIGVFNRTGQEFMPSLDEGSFLLMPASMPHSGMEANVNYLRMLDMAATSIPEVETVVGKAGRVESSLDPAPMNMFENVILYKSEYLTDEDGHRLRFETDSNGDFILNENGEADFEVEIDGKTGFIVPNQSGQYFRQWRDHIHAPDDIWNEIVNATKIPGLTSAPKLQPIETRLVMLQTGMRAPMGIKIKGNNLQEIEAFGLELEKHLKNIEGVKKSAVFAERIVGKPYLLLDINRDIISRYGLTVASIQNQIQAAIGGMVMTNTVEGRERYGIRIRYPRDLRSDPDKLKSIYVSTPKGVQIPLGELIDIQYEQGPQAIKSEDGFLIGYVLFDRDKTYAEVDLVHSAQEYLQNKIQNGVLEVPDGISYRFAGNYEQQVRANKRLMIVIPIALALIFLILYFQFSSIAVSLMVFSGVFVAFSGGFIMLGLYAEPWFMDFEIFGQNMRDLFQMGQINLSVAVWVGFLALFGIATDDGVLVATFLQDSFKRNKPQTKQEIEDAVVEGGKRRVKPAMMTTATTILALLPVLTSTGRGADIMLPMAIPSFGGMLLAVITMFVVPILFALVAEVQLKIKTHF